MKTSRKTGKQQTAAIQSMLDSDLELLERLLAPFDMFPLAIVITNRESKLENFVTIRAHSDNKHGQKMMNDIMVGYMAAVGEGISLYGTRRNRRNKKPQN